MIRGGRFGNRKRDHIRLSGERILNFVVLQSVALRLAFTSLFNDSTYLFNDGRQFT